MVLIFFKALLQLNGKPGFKTTQYMPLEGCTYIGLTGLKCDWWLR